jgi:hypothetical protein
MPLRGVKSPKRKRQYKHIKESYKKRGKSEGTAEEIAARTVNKERSKSGQTRRRVPRSRASRAQDRSLRNAPTCSNR